MELYETEVSSVRKRKVNDPFSVHQAFARKLHRKLLTLTIILIIAFAVILMIEKSGIATNEKMGAFVQNAGNWGPAALILIIAIASFLLTIPAGPLIILAGALYNPYWGTFYAMIGLLIGWSIAFAIARMFRGPIVNLLGEHAAMLMQIQDRFISTVLFVTRAFPIFSFEIISYAAGLTSISYSRYLLASLGAIAPIFVLAFLGSIGKNVALADNGIIPYALTAIVIIIIFVLPLAIDHYNPFGWKEKLLQPRNTSKLKTSGK